MGWDSKLTIRAASVTGWRDQQRDAWCTYARGHVQVIVVLDGVGERPDGAATAFEAVLKAQIPESPAQAARATMTELRAAYENGAGSAAAGIVAAVDPVRGGYGLAWLGDVMAFLGRPDGRSGPLTRPHIVAFEPENAGEDASPTALTRFLGCYSPEPLAPGLAEGRLEEGETLVLATDGVLARILATGTPRAYWWRRFLRRPPGDRECVDNATLVAIERHAR